MAGCILVDNDKIQVINRSPQYKNKYVHRRTSVALENLSNQQVRATYTEKWEMMFCW
jgi:hypothetical protein